MTLEDSRYFLTDSPEATRQFGAELAAGLRSGDFIALEGELAAGKTCLVQGLAEGLGCAEPVTSPTFALLNIYESGSAPLYHFDLYRLERPEELEGLGYEDYFYGDGLCAVEWSGVAEAYLPTRRLELKLVIPGPEPERRLIRLTCRGGQVVSASFSAREVFCDAN